MSEEYDERGYPKPEGPMTGGIEPCSVCGTARNWCRYWNAYSHMCCKDCSHLRDNIKSPRGME